jgi:flagellar basal-body rod modification protein FlgD
MVHQVPANYTLPTILNSIGPSAGVAARNAASTRTSTRAASSTTSASTSSSGTSVTALGSTFLSLLSTELQNQDPTAPVDSTDMVGQMISLNQLDQLISINQTITGDNTGTTGSTTGSVQKPAATANDTASSSAIGGLASSLPATVAGAAANLLPFDPTTLMPLNFANPGSTAPNNFSISPATMNFSPSSNHTSGGK